MLFVPDDLDFSVIAEDDEFVFTPEERRKIVRIWILFRTEKMNLRALSEKMQVSRRSIQNDVGAVQQELLEEISRNIRELSKGVQKGKFGLFR